MRWFKTMTVKPLTLMTIGLFVLVALLHALRIIFGWEVIINGTNIPMWISVVIPGGLAILIWLECRRGKRLSFEDYVDDQRANLASNSRLPHLSVLGGLTNKLYEHAIKLVPNNSSPLFGQLLLLCHKSFLSALILIGQAQPDDADPISRRAIEAARLALAVKSNPENAVKWAAYEKRMEGWQARATSEHPPPVSPKLELPRSHPILAELQKQLGTLSDTSVHFAPEYFGSRSWIRSEGRIQRRYFTSDQRTIECHFMTLVGIHANVLRIFDECLDGALFSNQDWKDLWQQLEVQGRPLAEPLKSADLHTEARA